MPTNHDETLLERYQREHRDYERIAMSEHTKGTLISDKPGVSWWVDVFTIKPNGYKSLPFISCKHHDPEANARRLVAAWNWCDGVDTESLEASVSAGRTAEAFINNAISKEFKLEAERDSLRAVNAELLEALKTARDHIDMESLDVSHCNDAEKIRAAIEKARAVLPADDAGAQA